MNLLPSFNIMPVPDFPQYTIAEVHFLDREAKDPNGAVVCTGVVQIFLDVNITDVRVSQARAVIAAIINTLSEQLECDDYNTYPQVTKARAYGLPSVM